MTHDENEPPFTATVATPVDSGALRELRVEDAKLYLDEIKAVYRSRPQVYVDFLEIMYAYDDEQICVAGVTRRVSSLFQGNRQLIIGFNAFLPPGYQIHIPVDGPPVAVYQAPGSHEVHELTERDESPTISVSLRTTRRQRLDQSIRNESRNEDESRTIDDPTTELDQTTE